MTTLRLTCLCLAIVPFAACTTEDNPADEAGSETGDLSGDTEDANSGSCGEETETVLTDVTVIPPGFDASIQDQIGLLAGDFSGTFVWAEADGPWSATHAGTESPLTAALSYSSGAVRLVEVELAGEPADGNGVGTCANYLVVDMALDFATDDGVFAESMVVALTIPGPAAEAEPSFYQPLDLDAMTGTLSSDDFVAGEGTITDVVLLGSLGDDSLYGSLGIGVEIGDGEDGISGFGFIASYTAAREN